MKIVTRIAVYIMACAAPAWPLFAATVSGEGFRPAALVADVSLTSARLDHAQPMESEQYPWSAIGKIFREDGGSCTGTMVAANLVLTTASCVTDNGAGSSGRLRFYPNYKLGNGSLYSDSAQVVLPDGGYDPRDPGTNWAIIRLNSNLGLKVGWLGWRILPDARNYRFAYAAYSREFEHGETAGYYTDCLSRGEDRWSMSIDCSIGADEEGGPIFAEFDRQVQVVGMATNSSRTGVDAAKASAFADRLRQLQERGVPLRETYTHICNRAVDRSVFKIAVAFSEQDRSFTSDGWYYIAPEECVEIFLRDARRNDLSVFAIEELADPRRPLLDRSFCVMDDGEFRIANADTIRCSEPGERLAQSSKRLDNIGPGNLSIFDFN
jgi:V8-like Glu-specific endopeptidase